jgi:hypothetical protein
MIVHVRFIVSSAPAIDGRQHRTDFGVDERRCRHERQHRAYGDSLYNIGDDGPSTHEGNHMGGSRAGPPFVGSSDKD